MALRASTKKRIESLTLYSGATCQKQGNDQDILRLLSRGDAERVRRRKRVYLLFRKLGVLVHLARVVIAAKIKVHCGLFSACAPSPAAPARSLAHDPRVFVFFDVLQKGVLL